MCVMERVIGYYVCYVLWNGAYAYDDVRCYLKWNGMEWNGIE